MSFDALFRKDRPSKMLQITPSRLVTAFTRTSGLVGLRRGFAINLASALIAPLSVGDGPEAWGWAAATGVLWGLAYFFWHRL